MNGILDKKATLLGDIGTSSAVGEAGSHREFIFADIEI
jgi:hypothetical protein